VTAPARPATGDPPVRLRSPLSRALRDPLVAGEPPPPADQRVSVTGRLLPPGGPTADLPIPRLAATEVGPYEEPANPYD
jgi:hypothetical protein